MKYRNREQITLYYYPGTRAVKIRWLLEELGLNYALKAIDLSKGEHKQTDYLAIHPLGKIPAISIDGMVIFESLAICLYLGDYYSLGKRVPTLNSPLRANYYQWLALASTTLEPALFAELEQQKYKHEKLKHLKKGPAFTPLTNVLEHINASLSQSQFLLGEEFSVADLMIASLLMLAEKNALTGDYKCITSWLCQLKQRKSYKKAIKTYTGE